MYIYIYKYLYIHTYIYIYIYTYSIGQVRFSEAVEVACSLAREKGFVDSIEQDVVACRNKLPLTSQVYIALD